MAIIKPFKALRPHKEYASQVASKPYDVLSSEEARKEATGNLISFLHVTKSEIDFDANVDTYSKEVYEKAKGNLQHLVDHEILFQEEKPCYYIYELAWKGRTQTGLVCVSSVKDYFDDVIKKHEFTRPEKEKDRIEHMKIIGAQTGNVFLACRDIKELEDVFHQWKNQNVAEYTFATEDGVTHSVWVVNSISTIDVITNLFDEKIPNTYIADGHHRAASAAKVSSELPNSEAAQYFLTTIFPAKQLAIMDYNRLVKDLNGLVEQEFLQKLGEDFTITKEEGQVKPAKLHEFGLYLGGVWYRLEAKESTYDANNPIGVLDVSILSEKVLDKLLGIKDQRTDKRIDFVGGIRGLGELEKRVSSNEMKVAFALYPVSIDQLFAIADSGNVMPPKSTWFEPKLRDGLFVHLI